MSGKPILAGETNVSTVIRILDDTTGIPETGVTSTTAGLSLSYRREGANLVNLTENTLSTLSAAHNDGGMIHIGAGYYRVDLPDAAVSTGTDGVLVFGSVTDMVVVGTYHPLVDFELDASVAARATPAQVQTELTNFHSTNVVDANVAQIATSTSAATRVGHGGRGIVFGTVSTGASTTSVPTSALDPVAVTANQFMDSFVVFKTDTTSTGLRGCKRLITASSTSGTLTVEALPATPASGDTFYIP